MNLSQLTVKEVVIIIVFFIIINIVVSILTPRIQDKLNLN